MKLIVVLQICFIHLTLGNPNDEIRNNENFKTYQLDVPGKEPITIFESSPIRDDIHKKWDVTETTLDNDSDIKNLMTHLMDDVHDSRPRCYGPSCQEGFIENEGPQEDFEDYVMGNSDKLKDFSDFSNERLQAIAALAAKLKKQKVKSDRFSSTSNQEDDNDDKVFTSWNRLKVKQHKHPYDDKDGWVTLEPVAWSTSKISKWKPNVKKQKPSYWNEDEDTNFSNDDRYTPYQDMESSYVYPQKRPTLSRPGFINNKLHIPQEYDTELPSKPSWIKNKPQQQQQPMQTFQSTWATDDSRRPYRPNCDKGEAYPNDESMYYGMSDSVMTDSRPSNFPYEYEALHQSSMQKRPLRRPTQVVYAGESDIDSDRSSRPPNGDGQWVLLSTTKGYRHKKRQRSLETPHDKSGIPSIVSHQAVALTVLPADDASQVNMTTSHGGLLEVERSFQTVEESKRDMDLRNDLEVAASQLRPVKTKVIKKKIFGHKNPLDSSTVMAAVGAGMVPATMAMVVPMMLGRRRRRDIDLKHQNLHFDNIVY
ncbi:uncharacterized protein LOC125068974 [Vanessa atalanta]|uniref:uncharacterized protein LOC125068974 n=1 Tax=Vanessa atalanta TaxID=42275 RepID=UPI001FCD47DE|nr:uncharacterized protein LOC125068974 [Vanessa atalanta]